jgi:hypothetical protein
LIEHGAYVCHARVEFASARELQEFLGRHRDPIGESWRVTINRGPARGYDGKPLHQADTFLSTPLPAPERPNSLVKESGTEYDGTASASEARTEIASPSLSWEQRNRFQKETKSILRQLGVTDLGRWR